jgi:hypothetical protein
MKMKVISMLLLMFMVSACGGGSGDVDPDNLDTNIAGQPLTNEVKAYKTAAQVPIEVMDQIVEISPAVVKSLNPTLKSTATCTESECNVEGDGGGSCKVTIVEAADNVLDFALNCDSFTYTDSLNDTYVVNGSYQVSMAVTGSGDQMIITMAFTTPSAFSVSANGEAFTYGHDFEMTIIATVSEEDVIMTIDVSGTRNEDTTPASFMLVCTDTDQNSDLDCTQTF